jgi:hypothetical protein
MAYLFLNDEVQIMASWPFSRFTRNIKFNTTSRQFGAFMNIDALCPVKNKRRQMHLSAFKKTVHFDINFAYF